ncbi:hypothetical protein CE195_11160, partial [Sodalis-like symbiont of Philaenus spumarius]
MDPTTAGHAAKTAPATFRQGVLGLLLIITKSCYFVKKSAYILSFSENRMPRCTFGSLVSATAYQSAGWNGVSLAGSL